ncbi:MAG: hypothetical protein KC417_05845 [Myxococcales bacterium]|nr:hypothetical protein [Myxococcales bacterium]
MTNVERIKKVAVALRYAAFVAGCAHLVVFVAACDEQSSGGLSISFDPESLADQTEVIELNLVDRCDDSTGGTALAQDPKKQWTLYRDGALPDIGNLSNGSYAFYARGFDKSCRLVSSGCQAFSVKASSSPNVDVVLGMAKCPVGGACGTLACSPLEDGGSDGETDAASDGGIDASHDAGNQPTVDWSLELGAVCNVSIFGYAACDASAATITTADPFQRGSVYANQLVSMHPGTSLEVTFTMKMDMPSQVTVADGVVFVIREKDSPTIGYAAGSLGYEGGFIGEMTYDSVTPSVAVEMDTYHGANDPGAGQHVAVLANGNVSNHLAWDPAPFSFSDVPETHVWVDYDGSTNMLTAYFSMTNTKPVEPQLTAIVDIPTDVGSQVYLGFTGSTGQYFIRQRITDFSFRVWD